jgi:anti-sigma regulatory factor (Ser/Thr protein kinase)
VSVATLQVTLHNQASEIAQAHEALDQLSAQYGLPLRCVTSLHLAIEEHLSNIISYGYNPGQSGTIHVRLRLEPTTLAIEVEDDARPFDPLTAAEPDTALPLDSKPLGGLGLLMIRRSVDEAAYRRANNRNLLTLRKRLT